MSLSRPAYCLKSIIVVSSSLPIKPWLNSGMSGSKLGNSMSSQTLWPHEPGIHVRSSAIIVSRKLTCVNNGAMKVFRLHRRVLHVHVAKSLSSHS
jgi:hypothetical protein